MNLKQKNSPIIVRIYTLVYSMLYVLYKLYSGNNWKLNLIVLYRQNEHETEYEPTNSEDMEL